MLAVQRQLTAVMALAVAMMLTAGCSSKGSDLALTGSETSSTDEPSTTLVATTAASTTSTTVSMVTTTSEVATTSTTAAPATTITTTTTSVVAPEQSDPSVLSARNSSDGLDAALLREIDAAVDQQDICGVYAALARVQLTASSTDRLLAQLTRIRDIMTTSLSFAPTDIRSDWSTVTDGTSDMVESLQSEGDAKRSAATHYDDDKYQAASRRVEDWMGRNCA